MVGPSEDFVQRLRDERGAIRESGQSSEVMEEVVASLRVSLNVLGDQEALPELSLVDAWQKLAVFSGHFDALAAYSIFTDDQIADWSDQEEIARRSRVAAKILSSLVSHSLIQAIEISEDDDVHFRFQVHDIFRDFAIGQIAENDWFELQLVCAQHFSNVLGQCDQLFLGHQNALIGLRLFDRERQQIESTWDRLNLIQAKASRVDRLIANLPLHGAYVLRIRLGTNVRADWLREALSRSESLDDSVLVATNAGNLGNVLQTRGDLDGAEEMYRKSLKINEELGRKEGMASDYGNLGIVLKTRGDLDGAKQNWQKSVAFFREIGAKNKIRLIEGWLDSLGDDEDGT